MHSLDHHITIDKGVIKFRKFRDADGTTFRSHLAFVILICGLIGYSVYEIVEEKRGFSYLRIFVYLIWLGPLVYQGLRWVFILTWRSRIKIENIKEIDSRPLENGVETRIVLYLKNGRRKEIVFRNAEPYLDAFLAQLSLPLSTA